MPTADEIAQHAIRTSRNEKRTVFIYTTDPTQAHEVFRLLFAESDGSIDDQDDQILWGEGWEIWVIYPHVEDDEDV